MTLWELRKNSKVKIIISKNNKNKIKKIIISVFLTILILFANSCDTFDMYIRKGLDGVNLYELSVYGEALGRDIKVVELAGFDVNNFRNDRVSYYISMYQGSADLFALYKRSF